MYIRYIPELGEEAYYLKSLGRYSESKADLTPFSNNFFPFLQYSSLMNMCLNKKYRELNIH